jgi:hypothetical protein
VCDVAEACDGSSNACPSNGFVSAGTQCRAAVAGGCDIAEACTGGAADCPSDVVAAGGTPCRPGLGACDVGESCTGSSNTCPADGFVAGGTVCRNAAGVCDVSESCTGSGPACPGDVFAGSGLTCRVSAGPCDPAENCTGSGAGCPSDARVVAGGTPVSACGALANVSTYSCDGSSVACTIGSCSASYCNVDGVSSNGCECGNDTTASNSCGGGNLGAIPLSGSAGYTGQLFPSGCGSNTEDWVTVQFPASRPGPGVASLTLSGNAVMDVYADCGGSGVWCGSGSHIGVTSYSQRDDQSNNAFAPTSYRTHDAPWNSTLYVRVRPSGAIAACGGGAYTLSATRPSECTSGVSQYVATGTCDEGCGPGDYLTLQYCNGGVWSTSPTGFGYCSVTPCYWGCYAACPGEAIYDCEGWYLGQC